MHDLDAITALYHYAIVLSHGDSTAAATIILAIVHQDLAQRISAMTGSLNTATDVVAAFLREAELYAARGGR